MRPNFRGLATTLALVLLVSCSHPHRAVVDRDFARSMSGVEALAVETDNGAVEVATDDSLTDIVVTAKLTGAGDTPEEALLRAERASLEFVLDDGGRAARLFVTFDGERRPAEGCALAIRIPPVAKLRIDTGNGDVKVAATSGELEIDTSNGSVVIAGHEGDAAVDTSNGNLTLDGVSGNVTALSSNGEILLRAGAGGVREFDLDTSNGGVEVDLGHGYAGSIDAATSNGSVVCAIPDAVIERRRNEALVQLGDGARSRVRTSNGSITIR